MRYIDADALIKKIYPMGIGDGKYTINAKAVKLAIDNAPTADVVPKSEVDLYKRQVDELEDELATTYDKLETAKADVAREIFEKIENSSSIIIAGIRHYVICEHELAELKKKYTEVEHEP